MKLPVHRPTDQASDQPAVGSSDNEDGDFTFHEEEKPVRPDFSTIPAQLKQYIVEVSRTAHGVTGIIVCQLMMLFSTHQVAFCSQMVCMLPAAAKVCPQVPSSLTCLAAVGQSAQLHC